MPRNFIVYGGELSYFTRKLEAAMLFYGAEFELRSKTPDMREEIESRSGTHQVPVLHTPENWMIADTTPLMTMLDGRFVDRRMYPDGPLGVLVHVRRGDLVIVITLSVRPFQCTPRTRVARRKTPAGH